MPPVAAAVAAVGAASGFAATAVAVSTVVSYVGVGLTVVGAITGNSKLAKIGAVMGAVGGVGSAIGAANGITVSGINEASKGATDNASADIAANVVGGKPAPLGDSVIPDATADTTIKAATDDPIGGLIDSKLKEQQSDSTGGVLSSSQNKSAAGTSPARASVPATATESAVTSSTPDTTAVSAPTTSGAANVSAGGAAKAGTSTPGVSAPTFSWSDLLAKNGGTLIQGVGSVVSGLASGKAAEQKLAEEKKQLAQQRADRSAASLLYSKKA